MTTPRFGDRVRTRSGATGRYLQDGLALYVSAMDNSLVVAEHDPDGDPPHPTLPAPSDEAIEAAAAGLQHSAIRPAITGPEWVTTPAEQHAREQAVVVAARALERLTTDQQYVDAIQRALTLATDLQVAVNRLDAEPQS